MRIIDPMLQELEHEMGSTRKLLERVPDNALDFKPHEKSMPLGRLAGHITEMLDWAVDIVKSNGMDMDPTKYKPFAVPDRGLRGKRRTLPRHVRRAALRRRRRSD